MALRHSLLGSRLNRLFDGSRLGSVFLAALHEVRLAHLSLISHTVIIVSSKRHFFNFVNKIVNIDLLDYLVILERMVCLYEVAVLLLEGLPFLSCLHLRKLQMLVRGEALQAMLLALALVSNQQRLVPFVTLHVIRMLELAWEIGTYLVLITCHPVLCKAIILQGNCIPKSPSVFAVWRGYGCGNGVQIDQMLISYRWNISA